VILSRRICNLPRCRSYLRVALHPPAFVTVVGEYGLRATRAIRASTEIGEGCSSDLEWTGQLPVQDLLRCRIETSIDGRISPRWWGRQSSLV
jgi:hypothetical protein